MMPFKTGKLPKQDDPRTLQVRHYLNQSVLEESPAAFDWGMRDGTELSYGMLGNDFYGSCVFTSAAHVLGTWSGQTGMQLHITTEQVLDAYGRFAGFRPDDPSTDRGAVMLHVARQWRTDPIAGETIKAFAEVDRDNHELVIAAANLFGGLWTGFALPAAWGSEPEEWTTGPGIAGQWAPGSGGGHAMKVTAVSPQGLVVRTWGGKRFVTWAAWDAYCDEAYVLLHNSLWTRLLSGRCPAGVDMAALEADLQRVTA